MRSSDLGKPKVVHPHACFWEPLQDEPTFVLRSMFGAKAVYLHGKIVLCFAARKEPWRGLLVPTERVQHSSLVADFPDLAPHPVLPKWLYISESNDSFEETTERLVQLVRRRDPRMGVIPKQKKSRTSRSRGPRFSK
jgi:hypothetical protein